MLVCRKDGIAGGFAAIRPVLSQAFDGARCVRPDALKYPASRSAWDAKLTRNRHTLCMATYQIIPCGNGSGFNIGVAGSDGARQTMLGFTSMEEAEAWIIQDRRLSSGAEYRHADGVADQLS